MRFLIVVFSLLLLSCTKDASKSEDHSVHEHESVESYYTCSMHPQVREDKPGKCPICHMNLTKVTIDKSTTQKVPKEKLWACAEDSTITSPAPGECPIDGSPMVELDEGPKFGSSVASVNLSATQIENFKAQVFATTRMKMNKKVRLLGEVVQAQQKESNIPLRVDGRVENVFIKSEGEFVRVGDAVIEIYSPTLISGGEEYIIARKQSVKNTNSKEYSELLQQSEQRLMNWGISAEQLESWFKKGSVPQKIVIHSPTSGIVTKRYAVKGKYFKEGQSLFDVVDLSTVWVELDVYEVDSALIKKDQKIDLRFAAIPGKVTTSKLDFVSPVIDQSTRTLKVRATIENSDGSLKIGMVSDGNLSVELPDYELVVPRTAVVDTGKRQIVWLQIDENKFEARLVRLGAKAGDYVQVLDGLSENDHVVARGNFMLDAQAQLFNGYENAHQH